MTKSFSIVMATLNSERTIDRSLRSIRAQNYPQEQVEILVIDGGSSDKTREIAARHGCRILDNPQVDPVSAKLIGMREATGDILIHVDSDEVLLSQDALLKRARAFEENPEIKMVFAEGYVNPPEAPFAARYINEFGDPFSMFYYRLSKDARFFQADLHRRYPVIRETQEYAVFILDGTEQPIMENAASANAIDYRFFRENFTELSDKPWGPVHFFYHMQGQTRAFAVTKDDGVMHYSADHWSGFLRKIKWRVRNNIFFQQDLGASGFTGRAQFDPLARRLKKYFFIPYAFLIVPALLDAVVLMWTRRDWQYVLHLPLTLYTAGLIAWMYALKILGYRPQLRSYGEQKTISRPSH